MFFFRISNLQDLVVTIMGILSNCKLTLICCSTLTIVVSGMILLEMTD